MSLTFLPESPSTCTKQALHSQVDDTRTPQNYERTTIMEEDDHVGRRHGQRNTQIRTQQTCCKHPGTIAGKWLRNLTYEFRSAAVDKHLAFVPSNYFSTLFYQRRAVEAAVQPLFPARS